MNDARLELGRCSGLAERVDVARHDVGEDDLDELGVRDARDQLDAAITRFCIPDEACSSWTISLEENASTPVQWPIRRWRQGC